MEEHARLFAKHGHEVTVFCQRGEGHHLPELPEQALFEGLGGQDIVFIHNVLTMPFQPAFTEALWRVSARLPQVRFVAWTHDVTELVLPAGTKVEFVAISELRRRELLARGVADCCVIPNGIDAARVLGLPLELEKLDLLDGRLIFLHPTRLLLRKNVECGIGIVKALGEATLIVTGAEDPHNPASREYARGLREFAESETIFANDRFPVGDAELAGFYRLADVLMFPSRTEGFGLPLLEARLHRLPAVYSAIEPMSGLAGAEGFPISPDESPAVIAARLAPWLAANPAISDRRRALLEYSWPVIYREHIEPLLRK
jgi:glycosyltransferase involved in cell wall biosynthesis